MTRLRLDAALYEPAPRRRPGQNGRPRKKGARLPTLEAVLAQKQLRWTTVTIEDWYGEGPRTVQIRTGTAVWYHTGKPVVPIRWVLIRDPWGEFDTQALLCTDLAATPEQILGWFVQRWPLEVTFEEARAHLGIETQRQWNEQAIRRTTPVLLGLFSIVTLLAHQLNERQKRLRMASPQARLVAAPNGACTTSCMPPVSSKKRSKTTRCAVGRSPMAAFWAAA